MFSSQAEEVLSCCSAQTFRVLITKLVEGLMEIQREFNVPCRWRTLDYESLEIRYFSTHINIQALHSCMVYRMKFEVLKK
jgi:hypothetical protein